MAVKKPKPKNSCAVKLGRLGGKATAAKRKKKAAPKAKAKTKGRSTRAKAMQQAGLF